MSALTIVGNKSWVPVDFPLSFVYHFYVDTTQHGRVQMSAPFILAHFTVQLACQHPAQLWGKWQHGVVRCTDGAVWLWHNVTAVPLTGCGRVEAH